MPSMTVFDRDHKRMQRDRAASSPRAEAFDYLKDYVALSLVERLDDLSRDFPMAVDVGCNAGHCLKYLGEHANIDAKEREGLRKSFSEDDERTFNCDHRAAFVVGDEETLPLQENSCDLILSSMSLHWINDLPGALHQIHNALKPNGVFLAAMVGGATLNELRMSFVAAEQERDGGVSPRTSPLAQVSDVGSLLVDAGFALPTVDTELVHCNYEDAVSLWEHLQAMGDSNSSLGRMMSNKRETMLAAASIYQTIYSVEDENASNSVPATFQIVFMIGWKNSNTMFVLFSTFFFSCL
eukprot:GSMAST32.ASY1.ANO1.2443.1 assembled CDS